MYATWKKNRSVTGAGRKEQVAKSFPANYVNHSTSARHKYRCQRNNGTNEGRKCWKNAQSERALGAAHIRDCGDIAVTELLQPCTKRFD